MSNLFDNTQLHTKLKDYKLPELTELKSILTRWHALLSTTTKNEEQLQTDFLNDIFGDILGYIYKRGEAETNLEKEEKTELDGQKPDGILGFFSEKSKDVRVIIELKDQKTDLDKKQNRSTDKRSPVEQAFGYVSKYQGVEWVIVSNFKDIRLYKSGYAGKFYTFTMEELSASEEKQKEFHFFFAKDRLFTKIPNQSPVHALDTADKGEEIEKRFYKHYSTLREEIWHNLLDLNKEKHYGRNFYLYKAQKLIDRIIFIRFCKENGALDNDAVLEALNNKYIKGKYNRMKALFTAMDEGNPEIGIAKFNGGLFAIDPDLDCLQVSDGIIDKIVILYSHDFGSDLDVNILGHIFEQSISDLENLTGDNEKKRKKDGVFYTPAYITEYIVKEAIGGWLADRKSEIKAKENSKEYWQAYAEKLKSIKVLDPACGSGAFLVKVFDYLQNEWREVEKHIKTDWTYKNILTHNIYGVDINPASTGITKLSLWLKTAHYREPLTTLDGNIKIGNSLIDNPDIAGYYSEFEGKVIQETFRSNQELFTDDSLGIKAQAEMDKLTRDGVKKSLAFKWNEEFAEVFATGGFDVVVGNPPYVNVKLQSEVTRDFIRQNYHFSSGADLYIAFIEKAYILINNHSYLSMIVPNKFFGADYGRNIRQLLQNDDLSLCKIWDLKDEKVFESASISTIACVLKKANSKHAIELKCKDNVVFIKDIFDTDGKIQTDINTQDGVIINKIKKFNNLQEYAEVRTGIMGLEYWDKKDIIYENDKDKGLPLLVNGNFNRYENNYGDEIALYKQKYYKPYISLSEGKLSENTINLFSQKKIICRGISSKVACIYDDIGHGILVAVHAIIPKDKQFLSLLAILNSKLVNWYHIKTQYSVRIPEGSLKYSIDFFKNIPIPKIPLSAQQPFIKKAQKMLDLTKQFNELSNKFIKLLVADLGVAKITKKLQKWYNLHTDEFFAEIGKQNKNLSLLQKSQWLEHFEAEKQKALALQTQITRTDAEIDKMVYSLYGLSEEEIGVVEGLV